jgi:hypothetical protein
MRQIFWMTPREGAVTWPLTGPVTSDACAKVAPDCPPRAAVTAHQSGRLAYQRGRTAGTSRAARAAPSIDAPKHRGGVVPRTGS